MGLELNGKFFFLNPSLNVSQSDYYAKSSVFVCFFLVGNQLSLTFLPREIFFLFFYPSLMNIEKRVSYIPISHFPRNS